MVLAWQVLNLQVRRIRLEGRLCDSNLCGIKFTLVVRVKLLII